jgi:hypothetical protein
VSEIEGIALYREGRGVARQYRRGEPGTFCSSWEICGMYIFAGGRERNILTSGEGGQQMPWEGGDLLQLLRDLRGVLLPEGGRGRRKKEKNTAGIPGAGQTIPLGGTFCSSCEICGMYSCRSFGSRV